MCCSTGVYFFVKETLVLLFIVWYSQSNEDDWLHANYRGQPKAGADLKMLFVPFVFSKSRFQGPAFRCDKIVGIVTLLEAIEGIPEKDYNFLHWGTKTSTTFTRDYFISKNLRVII